jgi:phenylpropionate dioxygenase-like ring-hydroxylating dioxygenase large terminal subunit
VSPPPREHWYIAARSRDLGRRPLAATVLGAPVVLFRTGDGRPSALADRCAHRNLALSRGRVVDDRLECAYHGWRYDALGACTLIPSLAEVPGRIGVPAYPTVEADGFVWIFGGQTRPAGAPRPFPHLGEAGWTTFAMKNRFEAGALACLENFLDCPHTAYVHRGWFRSARAKDVPARVTCTADEVRVEFDEKPERDSVLARLLLPRGSTLQHTDRFLMPATSRVDYAFGPDWHFIITSQCTPVTDEVTDVYTVVSFRARRIGTLVRLYFEPLCRRIMRQDLDVLRAQTGDVRRSGGPRFTSVASDLVGPRIARLWREPRPGASGSSSGGEPAPVETREVVIRY